MKLNKSDLIIKLLIIFIVLLFTIFSLIIYIDLSEKDTALFLIAINLCLTFLIGLTFEYILRKKVKKIYSSIEEALTIIKQNKEWTLDTNFLDENTAKTVQGIREIYKSKNDLEDERTEMLTMVNTLASNIDLEMLLKDLMPKILLSLESTWGAFYLSNNATDKLELKSALGFSSNIYSEFDLVLGEGFIGKALLTKEISIFNNIPNNNIFVTKTFLGKIQPRSVIIIPIINNDELEGVLCLASLYEYTAKEIKSLDMIRTYLGLAIGNCRIYERTKRLTSELQFQNSLIQGLNEELESQANNRNIFLQSIINSIKDYAIYVVDIDGVVLEWNKGAELLLGYTEYEVKGRPITDFYDLHDEMQMRVQTRMKAVLKNGYFFDQGWRIKRDGTQYYAEISAFAIYDSSDKLIGITSMLKDVTSIKIAENELWFQKDFTKILMEESRRSLIITTNEYIIKSHNEKAKDLFNSSTLTGQNITYLFDEPNAFLEFIGNPKNINSEFKLKIKGRDEYILISTPTVNDELSLMETKIFFLRKEGD